MGVLVARASRLWNSGETPVPQGLTDKLQSPYLSAPRLFSAGAVSNWRDRRSRLYELSRLRRLFLRAFFASRRYYATWSCQRASGWKHATNIYCALSVTFRAR